MENWVLSEGFWAAYWPIFNTTKKLAFLQHRRWADIPFYFLYFSGQRERRALGAHCPRRIVIIKHTFDNFSPSAFLLHTFFYSSWKWKIIFSVRLGLWHCTLAPSASSLKAGTLLAKDAKDPFFIFYFLFFKLGSQSKDIPRLMH